jgi:drug/metabolite transporter (DMT)-like permease
VSRRGWILFTAMCVIWGIPYLLIKVAVGAFTPASLVLLRTSIGALLLVPIAAARGELRPLLKHWKPVLVYTFVEVAAPWFLLSDAETHLSSSLTGLLVAAVPLVGAVVAWMIGSEYRLDGRRILGLLVGFAGVAALLGFNLSGGNLGAFIEIFLVTVGYAVGPMIVSRQLAGVPAVGVVAVSLGLSAIAYIPVGVAQLPRAMPDLHVLASVALLGVVCTAVAFLIFFALIAEVGPVRSTVITYFNPAVALALGVALLGEPLTLGAAIGFALILAGSYLATRRGTVPAGKRPARSGLEGPAKEAAAIR